MKRREREEILARPFDLFRRLPDKPYGPRPHQKPLLLNKYGMEYRRQNGIHTHSKDVCLCWGGGQSGKSSGCIAALVYNCLAFAGVQSICGAKVYEDLRDTIIDEMARLFTINKPWDHPLVAIRPNDKNKRVTFINGSFIRFFPYADWERLRGRRVDQAMLDEASQIEDANLFYEMIRRASAIVLPTQQIMLTTNPPESSSNWLYPAFQLRQFKSNYSGPRLTMGELCKCQFCNRCMDNHDEEIPWSSDLTCPNCGESKDNDCDGDQEWFRVVTSSAKDNDTLRSTYLQDQKGAMDEATFKAYGLGDLDVELRQGKIWKSYSQANVLPWMEPVDMEKPIIWTFDFNISFECSAIIQSMRTVQGPVGKVLDEIVLPESGPTAVAKEFIRRFPDFRQPVYLFGDPNGLNKSRDRNEASNYQVIYDLLADEGYDVHLMVERNEGEFLIPVTERLLACNTMMCDANGLRRLFFNPHVYYTMASFANNRYTDDGKVDKRCDRNAARIVQKFPDHNSCKYLNIDPLKVSPPELTHPSEAVSYWVAQIDRIIKRKGPDYDFHVVGDVVEQFIPPEQLEQEVWKETFEEGFQDHQSPFVFDAFGGW